MATSSMLRTSTLPKTADQSRNPYYPHHVRRLLPFSAKITSLPLIRSLNPNLSQPIIYGSDNNSNKGSGSNNNNNNGRGGGGGGSDNADDRSKGPIDPIGLFLNGWRARVSADPQFPFKVLMEELVGVSACVLGDMASRPNFGLNELDFVFSTLVVGSILNFVLMYLLAPNTSTSSVVTSLMPSYIFEPGNYALSSRFATLISKGVTFAAVGFAAGLVGTALSNGLIKLRKKMDPEFEPPNKPPPTLLNSMTWAAHMGLSSNLRYQTLNGVECVMGKVLPPAGFKVSVVGLRCLNNVLGGVSFVVLARLTGSQKVEEKVEVEERLVQETVMSTDERSSE